MVSKQDKIRRIAFTTQTGKVQGINFYIEPVQRYKEILRLLRKQISEKEALEVSSFSEIELGKRLSAFNIPYRGTCLECVFQASKVFEKGGPYLEWLDMSPKDVKKDPKKKSSGKVQKYIFEGQTWLIEPKTAFYDFIYIDAVKGILSEQELEEITKYKYFTDVALDPEVSTNCQARSMAIIQLMLKLYGKILDFSEKEEFIEFHKKYVSYDM